VAEHGGYRKPANPAPVSGPGKYAKRTDGGPAQSISAAPGQPYGDKKAEMAAQRIAPMGGSAPLPTPPSPQGGDQAPPSMPAFTGVPLNAPTQRPGEPITHGVNIGPGAGSEALNLPAPTGPQGTGAMSALLGRLSASDMTGALAPLLQAAQARGV
jgi:hypothetical protein